MPFANLRRGGVPYAPLHFPSIHPARQYHDKATSQ